MTTTPAQTAVRELIQAFEWLLAVGFTSEHRSHLPITNPELLEQLAHDAAIDRFYRHQAGRDGTSMQTPLGESPAPMDLTIADLFAETADAADELCRTVSYAAGAEPLAPAIYAFTDPRPFLRQVDQLLPRAAAIAATVEKRCDSLVFRITNTLGLVGDGQILQVVCPWCDGRTPKTPVGGAFTMRIRTELPAGHRSIVGVKPEDVEWYVVCESGLCRPPETDYGSTVRGRPAWNLRNEGEWLAHRLEKAIAS
jgi:hypothetical protein